VPALFTEQRVFMTLTLQPTMKMSNTKEELQIVQYQKNQYKKEQYLYKRGSTTSNTKQARANLAHLLKCC